MQIIQLTSNKRGENKFSSRLFDSLTAKLSNMNLSSVRSKLSRQGGPTDREETDSMDDIL